MNEDRRHARWTGTQGRSQDSQAGPSWLVIAAVRPWVLPVFDRSVGMRGIDEPNWPGPANVPQVWMKRVRPDRWDLKDEP
jgi:hypothetical protein